MLPLKYKLLFRTLECRIFAQRLSEVALWRLRPWEAGGLLL